MSAAVIYAHNLFSLGHGRPLWVPESSVEIGDVGFLEISSGKFTRLMNVMHPADHPLNMKRGVPDKYEQLDLKEEADFIPSYLNYGPTCSYSVKKVHTAGSLSGTTPGEWAGVSGSYSFSCSEDAGAVLLLNEGADRSRHMCSQAFMDYMLKWYDSWCLFAENRGYRIGDPELLGPILVRGWIKASSWGVAAWKNTSRSHEVEFQGEIGGHVQLGVSFSITTGSSNTVSYRCGPGDPTFESKSIPAPKRQRDQCVFISYFQAKKRTLRSPKIVAAAETPPDQGHEDRRSPSFETESLPTAVEFQDPLDAFLDTLLEQSSSDIVVACDEDVHTEARAAPPGDEWGMVNDDQQSTLTANDGQRDTFIAYWFTPADDPSFTSDAPSCVNRPRMSDLPFYHRGVPRTASSVPPELISSVSSPSSTPLVTPCSSERPSPAAGSRSTPARTLELRLSLDKATHETILGARSHSASAGFVEDTIEGAMAQDNLNQGD